MLFRSRILNKQEYTDLLPAGKIRKAASSEAEAPVSGNMEAEDKSAEDVGKGAEDGTED